MKNTDEKQKSPEKSGLLSKKLKLYLDILATKTISDVSA
jgi:hypothetical protein